MATGAESLTNHPIWMLGPWAVFALAAGIKFWRLTSVFRRYGSGSRPPSEQFRQTLERIWAKPP